MIVFDYECENKDCKDCGNQHELMFGSYQDAVGSTVACQYCGDRMSRKMPSPHFKMTEEQRSAALKARNTAHDSTDSAKGERANNAQKVMHNFSK